MDVGFLHGDLLKPFAGAKANYLVCNPPYIAEHEFPNLGIEVRDFEPRGALVSGPSGLEVYARLAADLKGFLTPSANVWFEIGNTQGPAICEFFKRAGWVTCKVEKDWAGKDRFFFLENE